MSKANLSKIGNNFVSGVKKRSPEILITMGVAGLVSAGIMGVRATPRALMIIEEEKERINKELFEEVENTDEMYCPIDKLRPIDTLRLTWKCYIPAVTMGVVSIACIVGGSSINMRRNAALATAYTLSEATFREYRDKVVETVGEKKEKTVREKVSQERIDRDPIDNKEIIITEKGNTVCYDVLSGRYFKSDMDQLNKAVNEVNRRMISQNYISLNEFYYEIGLSGTKLGNEMGWRLDNGMIELDFSAQLASDGNPCLVVDYTNTMPQYDFDKWF